MANLQHGTRLFAEFLASPWGTPEEARNEKLWLRWRNQVSPEEATTACLNGEALFFSELEATHGPAGDSNGPA